MKKIEDFNPDMLWTIDNLMISQTKDKIRCVFKYPIDGSFLIAILCDERNGEYFITSQKEPHLNGAILNLSERQQEKIAAFNHILRIYNQIEDETERLDEYELELFDKYLKFEFQKKEFWNAIIIYCQSLISSLHPPHH